MASSVLVPSIWFPFFILSPSHTSFSSLFFHVFLSSCSVISSLSFFAHTLGRPGLYNEVGSHRLSLCTWFPFIATAHLCPVLSPLHVFILLSFCVHTHTFALTLVPLASPRGGVCVCVTLGITGILLGWTCSFSFNLLSRGHADITQTHANEAMRDGGRQV